MAACIACLAPLPYYGLRSVRSQWLRLAGRFPRPDAASGVVAALALREPQDVLLVNCFWAYRFSHLRGARPASVVDWSGAQDTQHVLDATRGASLIVTFRTPGDGSVDQALLRLPLDPVYEDAGYVVLAHAPRRLGEPQ